MERPEVPLEQTQEEIVHHAHASVEKWIMGVALTTALFAVFAAVTALLAEHHANEAMIEHIERANQWSYYQAKSIKEKLLKMKVALLSANDKNWKPDPEDSSDLEKYKEERQDIEKEAREKEAAAKAHLKHHMFLSLSVTMFQVAIAVGAISVLTRRRNFWFAGLAFGAVGLVLLGYGLVAV
jgi:uncharacterized membrane protein